MTFATAIPDMFELSLEPWKEEPPIEHWAVCSQCTREFAGPGSATEGEAILRGKLAGWLEWTRFSSCEGLDPALGKELFCPRCSLEFKT